jgi:hypothetical protein
MAGPGIVPGTTSAADPLSAFPVAGDTGHAQGRGTGQHGITPIIDEVENDVQNAITDVWDWLNKPFTQPASPWGIALIVLCVLLAVFAWNLILYHIRIAAESI